MQHHPNKPQKSSLMPNAIVRSGLLVLALSLSLSAHAQKYLITSNWFANVGTNHIAVGDANRGLCYSALSNVVFVCNKGVPAIDAFDALTGNSLGSVPTTGVSGGTFLLNQAGVADDGDLYSGNLSTAIGSSAYKLYQWTNWTTAPT